MGCLKVFAYSLYFVSFFIFYGFFIAMSVGHGYFFIESYSRPDCYATMDKNSPVAYDDPNATGDLQNVS